MSATDASTVAVTAAVPVRPRTTVNLLKDTDLTRSQMLRVLDTAGALKAEKAAGAERPQLSGRNIAIVFQKPSTRTRSAFEIAAHDEGAGSTFIDPVSSHMGESESIRDTAEVLGRLYDGIAFRGFEHATVEEIAEFAGVPVWNALTDAWHPTQALADILTIREHTTKRTLRETSVCFVGDGRNNVARSLLTACAIIGIDVRIAAPRELWPDAETVATATALAARSDGAVTITEDPSAGTSGADFVYTDVWVSMGEAEEIWDRRVRLLRPYRVDTALIESTGNPDTAFLHCLPSIHNTSTSVGARIQKKYGLDGAEVTDEVFCSSRSRVLEQAGNRVHTIKAVMLASLRPVGSED